MERGKAPRGRRFAIWADNAGPVLTVSPQQNWIKIVEGRQGRKGGRVYAITIDPATLPPGRLHDGIIRVGSSTGWLDLPVTVELHTTN